MSRRSKYDPEVHAFIREHVKGHTCQQLADMVNEHFGKPLFTKGSMHSYKCAHKLKSGKCVMPGKYSADVIAYLKEIAEGRKREEISRLINERFGEGTMSTAQVNAYMNNHGIRSGVGFFKPGNVPFNKGRKGHCAPGCERTWFQKGHRSDNAVPVGTEREQEDGYIAVKVQDGHKNQNWVAKHRLIWEQAHGPIPPGHIVIFLNGDRRDFRLENLKMISRAEHGVMCKRGLHFPDSALTETGALIAKVVLEANKKRR